MCLSTFVHACTFVSMIAAVCWQFIAHMFATMTYTCQVAALLDVITGFRNPLLKIRAIVGWHPAGAVRACCNSPGENRMP